MNFRVKYSAVCVVIEMNYTFFTTRTSVQEWDLMFCGLKRVGIWDKTVWKTMEEKSEGLVVLKLTED